MGADLTRLSSDGPINSMERKMEQCNSHLGPILYNHFRSRSIGELILRSFQKRGQTRYKRVLNLNVQVCKKNVLLGTSVENSASAFFLNAYPLPCFFSTF